MRAAVHFFIGLDMRDFLSVYQIAEGTGGRIVGGSGDVLTSGVCINSKEIKNGDCFFAIKGEKFDGHSFVAAALESGAVCAVVRKGFACPDGGKAIIEVDDTTAALGRLAVYYRDMLTAKVVGITGSVGKTSTRDIVAQVLAAKYKCHSAKKSFNNHIGLPLTILETPRDCEVLVLELGTNHPGEIEYLAKIASPDIAVITKVAASHLEFFGTIENIAAEKAAIARGLTPGGRLIVNADSKELISHLDANKTDYLAYDIADKAQSLGEFGFIRPEGADIRIPLAGMGNLENAMAAYLVCREVGLDAREFEKAAAGLQPADMRLNLIEVGGIRVINDCYNANPQSMANAIDTLGRLKKPGARSVLICGDMKELGAGSEMYHSQLGAHAADTGINVIAAVGKFAPLVTTAAKKCRDDIETLEFPDTDSLCEKLCGIVKTGDTVLVKGSRTVGLEKAIKKLSECS